LEALVDTSFLLLLFESGKDLFSLIEDRLGEPVTPIVLKQVLKELARISGRPGRRGRLATLALSYAEKMRLLEAGGEEDADKSLILVSKERGLPIITADWRLMREVRSQGCGCIYVNRRLEIHVFV
jgi:rRNA-processing protein FCF1